ncbi:MAG TPA: hypothetical protein VFE34_16360 [Dongiaceae bacterium]|nr:hypothetical protein [Dongiaceae bacterium]
MARYSWPGDRDPNKRDDARFRGEALLETIANIPGIILAEAAALRAALLATQQAVADQNVWLPIGPSVTLQGQAGSAPRVAGRVRDLAVSDDGKRVYAATANGGVWYSGDAGATWSPLGAGASTPAGEAAAPGPSSLVTCCIDVVFGANENGSQDIVYVGTGETQPYTKGFPGGRAQGIGVLKLTTPLPQALANPHVNPWKREAKNLAGTGIFRIAHDPTNPDVVIAASSSGLWRRIGPFTEDANWTRVTAGPFDFEADDAEWCTDVIWAPAKGGTPSRLWVTLVDNTLFSDTGLWVSENGVNGPYEKVDLSDHVKDGRLGIAVHKKDPSIVYVLGKGPHLWRINGKSARRVKNIPTRLFGDGPDDDHSNYDLAIAAHPDKPDEVILGGNAVQSEQTLKMVNGKKTFEGGEWSAALFRLTITADGGDFTCNFDQTLQDYPSNDDKTYIGNNVHSDVHTVRFAAGGSHVWVGCDGGAYRSTQKGDSYTYIARNNGLAVIEAGYVANHPTCDGALIIGTQDNGAIRRTGNTVWTHWSPGGGDGGGVAYHPTLPAFHIAQYTKADWNSNGSWVPPVFRSDASDDSTKAENKVAAFYSDLHVIPGVGQNQARVAIGTNRLWISEDWNPDSAAPKNTWQTLPSGPGKDPRLNGGNNTSRDALDDFGNIRVVQWAGPPGHLEDRIIVLCGRAVVAFVRDSGTGKWSKKVISHYDEKCGDDEMDNDEIGESVSSVMPPRGSWSDLAIHDYNRGTYSSFYVAATGFAEFDDDTLVDFTHMDTLWWFDGTNKWYPTRLRGHPNATRAPAFAVVVDPDDIGIVYAGTAAGIWKGTLTFVDGKPKWDWTIFSNGLPDAYIQDLAFFKNGDLKLLRAALQARGVWEVDISAVPTPPRRTYLRAHALDTRRRFPTVMTDPLSTMIPPVIADWFSSPDIMLRPAPGAPPPSTRPSRLPWNDKRHGFIYDVWVLQTALHADDPLVRPNGVWDQQLEARIKAFRKNSVTLPASDTPLVDDDFWDEAVVVNKVYATPWGDDEPTEADVTELIRNQDKFHNNNLLILVQNLPYVIDVLVHHRHFEPVPLGQAQVFLLRRLIEDAENDGGDVALTPEWKNAVVQWMNGTPTPLPDKWEVVGRRMTQGPLSATMPRVVSFGLDFTPDPPFANNTSWLLLAITSSSVDPVDAPSLTGDKVRDLVLNSHHVAARLVRKEA